MYGARVSIAIGVMAVLVSGVLGVAAGVTAGFYGGIVDELLMRLANLRLALPFVLLVISVIAVFGPSFTNLIVILGLTGWVPYAKIVRAEALSMRERIRIGKQLVHGLWTPMIAADNARLFRCGAQLRE